MKRYRGDQLAGNCPSEKKCQAEGLCISQYGQCGERDVALALLKLWYSIDKPASPCGDMEMAGQSMWRLFYQRHRKPGSNGNVWIVPNVKLTSLMVVGGQE